MVKRKPTVTHTKIVYNKELDEYHVKAYGENGRMPDADYFTDDKEDAIATASDMNNDPWVK